MTPEKLVEAWRLMEDRVRQGSALSRMSPRQWEVVLDGLMIQRGLYALEALTADPEYRIFRVRSIWQEERLALIDTRGSGLHLCSCSPDIGPHRVGRLTMPHPCRHLIPALHQDKMREFLLPLLLAQKEPFEGHSFFGPCLDSDRPRAFFG